MSVSSAVVTCPAGVWTAIWRAGGPYVGSRQLSGAGKAVLRRASVGIPPYYEVDIVGTATLVWAGEAYLEYGLKPEATVSVLLGPMDTNLG